MDDGEGDDDDPQPRAEAGDQDHHQDQRGEPDGGLRDPIDDTSSALAVGGDESQPEASARADDESHHREDDRRPAAPEEPGPARLGQGSPAKRGASRRLPSGKPRNSLGSCGAKKGPKSPIATQMIVSRSRPSEERRNSAASEPSPSGRVDRMFAVAIAVIARALAAGAESPSGRSQRRSRSRYVPAKISA